VVSKSQRSSSTCSASLIYGARRFASPQVRLGAIDGLTGSLRAASQAVAAIMRELAERN
jgi:hypothetical protein